MWSAIITAVGNIFGGAFNASTAVQVEKSKRNAADQNGTTVRKFASILPVVALFVAVIILITKK